MKIHISKFISKKKAICFFQTVFLLFLLLFLVSHRVPLVADFLEKYIAIPARTILSFVTAYIPVPLFELFIAFLPIVFAFIIFYFLRSSIKSAKAVLLLCVQALLFLYCVNLAIPAISSSEKSHGVGDIDDFAVVLAAEFLVNKLSLYEKPSVPTEELLEKSVLSAADLFHKEFFGRKCIPKVKNSLLSEFLTEANILAYYAFPTSEIIINTLQPSYMMAYTSAHEVAHFYGIAREDEANLFSFRALIESDHPYLAYSAALRAYEYLSMPLYNISKEKYNELFRRLPDFARADLAKSLKFSSMLGGGSIEKMSGTANDAILSLRDERGAKSYSNTARLLINYISSEMLP